MVQTIRSRHAGFTVVRGGKAAALNVRYQILAHEFIDRHALEDICAVDGVDGVFVGPGDLAASLGYIGQLGHETVLTAVEDAIIRIRACGKAAGILAGDVTFAMRCITLGTSFTAVGVDVGLLARAADSLAKQFVE